jgi:ArsR family transcriptional regulator, virulence genes transcriptional regulator
MTGMVQDYEAGRDRQRDLERYRLHADICRVLTDPKRLMLLDVLQDGDRSVGELAEELGCTLANASQHLSVLRSAGLVDTYRQGTSIHYHLAEPELLEACGIIQRIVARRLAADATATESTSPQPSIAG